ncbi:acyltransferase family protein [Bifidobacterium sp. 82T10]|uniref:Acyltransferase family protein n=1 Tax=Bifidobacterium miconis TaxID=2834435 RepID=A0ABS6WCF8_9BIFI|nr:acyltransferase family protein [Bifidobacterium miconis]
MPASRGRILWVDYAKAFAIIGVFVMHGAAPDGLSAVVSAYDMMVFFFLSGFVFSTRKYRSFPPFLRNKVRTLIVPGLFLSVVPFLVERLIGLLHGETWSPAAYLTWFAGYAINLRGHDGFGVIPWFLTCLFMMEVGGYALLRFLDRFGLRGRRRDAALVVAAVIAVTLGWTYSAYVYIVLPWGCDVALSMFGFFVLGILLRRHARALRRALSAWVILPAAMVLIVSVWVNGHVFHGSVNPYMNDLGNPACFVVGAVSGVWMVLAVSRLIADVPAMNRALGGTLSYWGRNTLVFYCVNAPIYPSLIPWLLSLIGLDTTSSDIAMRMACCFGAILINLAICTPCAEIMNRCLPGILGKTQRSSAVAAYDGAIR